MVDTRDHRLRTTAVEDHRQRCALPGRAPTRSGVTNPGGTRYPGMKRAYVPALLLLAGCPDRVDDTLRVTARGASLAAAFDGTRWTRITLDANGDGEVTVDGP